MTHSTPDPHLQRALDSLEASGLEVLPNERTALAEAARFGQLEPHMHLLRRALLLGSVGGRNAETRRWVRQGRATATADGPAEFSDDGLIYRCAACRVTFPAFIDPEGAKAFACAHRAVCEPAGGQPERVHAQATEGER